jgi:exodeoxyribonuclease V beta subunit
MSGIDLKRHGILEAHAGTGKTHTIVEMVLELLQETPRIKLSQILLVTYTQKAAGELKKRIRERLEEAEAKCSDAALQAHLRNCLAELPECWIGTIHSVSLRILRSWPFESSMPLRTELVDDEQGLDQALREAWRTVAWPWRDAPLNIEEWLLEKSAQRLLERARSLGLAALDPQAKLLPEEDEPDPQDAAAPAKTKKEREAQEQRRLGFFLARWSREAGRLWRGRKEREGLVSYNDILSRLAQALENDNFRSLVRREIRVGIVDEFQDTSSLQWSIFRRWFVADNPSMEPRLFLVGDPKQSIYSFQGADVRTYLKACDELEKAGGKRHQLKENWRSTGEMVESVNRLLCQTPWFSDGIDYPESVAARVPTRADDGPERRTDWLPASLLVRRETGSAAQRRAGYAETVTRTILDWHGRKAWLPDGDEWIERPLDWHDFAVLLQTRTSLAAFRRAFRRHGIPWSFYKQQGVFASRAARELRVLLSALHEPTAEVRLRVQALLTRFFAVPLEALNPSQRLSETSPEGQILSRLRELAGEANWPRLFREILSSTAIQSRLLAEPDGDRQWMDLRQVSRHALEYLLTGNGGLPELIEHLGRLADGDESAAQDENLHARETERGRVQILTMHVSKGLDFPVVFLATSGKPRSGELQRWIGEGPRLHICPKEFREVPEAKLQAEAEQMRLYYVALTRSKLALVAPCFASQRGSKLSYDDLLSQRLVTALEAGLPGIAAWEAPSLAVPTAAEDLRRRAFLTTHPRSEIEALALPRRRRFLSSYTALSRPGILPGLEGRGSRSEEFEEVPETPEDDWLPRGAHTGDCLHELLEGFLGRKDLSWCEAPDEEIEAECARSLQRHGLDKALSPQVARLLANVLRSPLPLPSGKAIRLCDLEPQDRRAEMEFHAAFGDDGQILSPSQTSEARPRGWLVGYIDLLFRVEGLWYVLDWKTTWLPGWDPASLSEGMASHDYRLQASLYSEVVSRSLRGARFGGAVYVFLRAFASGTATTTGVWSALPSPADAHLSRERLTRWLHERFRETP